jgi:hypothetical protein
MAQLIGFCGAGGTGKTTTAHLVCELTGLPFIQPSSRNVFKRMGVESESAQEQMTGKQRIELQRAIQDAYHQSVMTHYQSGLSDRTPIDHFVYTLMYCGAWLDEYQTKEFKLLCTRSLMRFKHIFYFPLTTFSTIDDGMRQTAYGSRLQFDLLMRQMLNELGVSHSTVRIGLAARIRAQNIAAAIKTLK